MYKLIGSLKTRTIRVLWMLEELRAEYLLEQCEPRSKEALAYNPSGKVPMLQVGDDVIIDSVAICQYLADAHGRFTHKAGTIERGHQDSWTNFAVDELDGACWFAARNTFILPKDLRSEKAIEACKYEFGRAMGFMQERLPETDYVSGDELTVPDILLTHCANWATNMFKWEIPEGKVSDYFDRVRARPAYKKAMELREKS